MPTMPPILVSDLFAEVTSRLLELLHSLSPDEWHRATISSRRTVKDIASHLLDGSLRRLSMQRDRCRPDDAGSGPRAGERLVDFLNRLKRRVGDGDSTPQPEGVDRSDRAKPRKRGRGAKA